VTGNVDRGGKVVTDTAQRPAAAGGDRAGAGATWSVQVRTEDDALSLLEEEWRDLHRRCQPETPFQSYAWLQSWWREYGRPGRLRLVLVRRAGTLVGAAPFMLVDHGPWRILGPVGGDESDFHDVLLDAGSPADVASRLVAATADVPDWHVLDIPGVRPGAAAEQLSRYWPAPQWRAPESPPFGIQAGATGGVPPRLPDERREDPASTVREAHAAGIEARCVAAGEVAEAVSALLRMYRACRQLDPERLGARFERHLVRALTPMVEEGQARLTEYRVSDELVAADVALVGPAFIGTYLAAFAPAVPERLEPARTVLAEAFATAAQLERPAVSLLHGDFPPRSHWRPAALRNHRLLLSRPRGPHRVQAAYALRLLRGAVDSPSTWRRLPVLQAAAARPGPQR
jgi:CelD/BcsL family acetyltransferase involved in cellulose biosynthesis